MMREDKWVYYKSMFGMLLIVSVQNLGFILYMWGFKILGSIHYIIGCLVIWWIAYHYMNSKFYKELGSKK